MTAAVRLRHRVGEAIARHGLWRPGDRVAVAVSGGLDSVCLLHLLHATRGWHEGVLSAVTIDHGTRAGAVQDAELAVSHAVALGLPCHRVELALGPDVAEARCRAARYAALDELAVERVALGHHRDDQAETLLLRLLRGTGPRGLIGMRWRRDRYVRPLLAVPRAELRAWAEARDLRWRENPTNEDPRYLRNRVRHELLPLLEDLRPGAVGAIARTATLAVADGALLDRLVDETPEATPGARGWPLAWITSAPEPVVRRALHRHVPGLSSAHVDAALRASHRRSGVVELPGELTFQVTGHHLRLVGRAR